MIYGSYMAPLPFLAFPKSRDAFQRSPLLYTSQCDMDDDECQELIFFPVWIIATFL